MNQFLVLNSRGERAVVECNVDRSKYRYSRVDGDPLGYGPVVDLLARKGLLDADGFASAGDWAAETMAQHYPLALERIVRGLTRVTLNPATILISLKDGYAHAGWAVNAASHLVAIGGTHGGLDDLTSDGILLSNFAPTRDTSTDRAADQFGGFPNVNNYRAQEDGAELVSGNELALARIQRTPIDRGAKTLPGDQVFVRVWTPLFAQTNAEQLLEIVIDKTHSFTGARTRPWDGDPPDPPAPHFELNPVGLPETSSSENIYAIPPGLSLAPRTEYQITGWGNGPGGKRRLFRFIFWTDGEGRPTAY